MNEKQAEDFQHTDLALQREALKLTSSLVIY